MAFVKPYMRAQALLDLRRRERVEKAKTFSLPKLAYGLVDLAPYISEERLGIHDEKNH